MEFSFDTQRKNPDLARLGALIEEMDPAAVLDLDASGQILRLSTVLSHAEVLECLRNAGLASEPDRLRQLPSQCCGGCSG